MKINLTKADEKAINDALPIIRLAFKNYETTRPYGVTKYEGQKVINGLKKILEKHEIRKSKEY